MKKALRGLLLVTALTIGSLTPSISAQASTQVAVFGPAGMGGGGLGCSDEVDNLVEIIGRIDGYTVDRSITSLGAGLLTQLNSSKFFFVPDMETGFNPDSSSDFPSSAVTDFQTWLTDGGVLVMTGTNGDRDIKFINKITSWGLADASPLSPASRNDTNAAGTPFGEATLAGVTLTPHSATDAVNKNTAPSSAAFTTMWGTDAQAAVAVMTYGRGKIIYLAWDFYDSGYTEATPEVACGQTNDPWVTKVVPAALKYATQLADQVAASRNVPASVPPAPKLPRFDAFASGPVVATPGKELVLTGARLNCTSQVQINGTTTTHSHSFLPSGLESLSIGIPANLSPGRHMLQMDSCDGNVVYENLIFVPKPPVVFEAVTTNSFDRMFVTAKLQSFVLKHYSDYNSVECIVNSTAKSLEKSAAQFLESSCKLASMSLAQKKGYTTEKRSTHKPANIWIRVTLTNK